MEPVRLLLFPTFLALALTFSGVMTALSESGHVRKPLPSAKEIAKLPKDGGEEFNRLIFEQSPYLLQHARNPVDWYPWGEEAFERAKAENKPVFLSIGYTTCHWCHVMEHESFEDDEVGAFLSEHFIPVKVDREERPDIDDVYMTVTQAVTGGGGWPMTVVMTPDKKPFFAGTYFPKNDRARGAGLMTILRTLSRVWNEDNSEMLENAEKIVEFLQQTNADTSGELPGESSLHTAYQHFAQLYDPVRGGFGRAPKFPMSQGLSFLLRYHHRTGESKALEMVENTLRAMRRGGVYDHVGFGTHRYSTDAEWLLPHFEKMLYDQALLVIANLEAYQVTKDSFYEETAREVLHYVTRDMTSPEGGFYSAEDADSEGEEGTFYVWKPEEIKEVLGEEDGELYLKVYQILPEGNFREEATGVKNGDNIPHLTRSLAEWSEELEEDPAEFLARMEGMRQKLFAHRETRVHPQKDDKILTDWNGLMISAFAKASQVFGDSAYLESATKAADFLLAELKGEDGRLLKRYRAGQSGLMAHLEDYAFVVAGMLDLYEAGFDVRYLREAIQLTDDMVEHFWDDAGGGFFSTADDGEQLLVRMKKIYGGAIPSGNSVAAVNLARLYRMTGRSDFETRLEDLLKAFGKDLQQFPGGRPIALFAVDLISYPSQEVVLAGELDSEGVREMLEAVHSAFLPGKVLLHRPAGEDPEVARLSPFLKDQQMQNGKATAYVCEDFACKLPTNDVAEFRKSLGITPQG